MDFQGISAFVKRESLSTGTVCPPAFPIDRYGSQIFCRDKGYDDFTCGSFGIFQTEFKGFDFARINFQNEFFFASGGNGDFFRQFGFQRYALREGDCRVKIMFFIIQIGQLKYTIFAFQKMGKLVVVRFFRLPELIPDDHRSIEPGNFFICFCPLMKSHIPGGRIHHCGSQLFCGKDPVCQTSLKAESSILQYTFEFVKTEDLENAVSDAIIQTHRGGYKLGTYACEDHEIFATESVDTGDYETVTVYMWVNYGEFIKYGDSLVEISGSACPTVLTFDCVDGKYNLKEYWTAEDGSHYADSIREKYPKNIVSEVMSFNYNRNALEKKAEVYFYDNKKFYSATNYGNVSVNVVSYKLDSGPKTDKEEFVRIEWHNQSETTPFSYGTTYYIEKFNPDLLGFEVYKPTEEPTFTAPVFYVEPGQKREQRYDLGVYDFSEPGYYRFVTNFNFDEMDREGVAIVDFTVGDIALKEKSPEEYTTQAVYTDNDFKALFSRVGSTNEGYDIINKYAEKSIYTQYSSQTPFPVIRFDSKDELDGFIKEGRKAFYLDSDSDQDYSFLKNTEEYTEEFFEDKSVILVYVTESSGSIRHEVDSVIRRDGIVYVFMDRIVPEVCTDDMASWFITVAVDKDLLSDCNNIIASIGDEVYVPQNTTLKDVVYSVSKSTVNYLENGGEILAEYAEIPIKTPKGGVDYYHGARFETLEGFVNFYNVTQNIFSYDSIKGYPSFNQMKAQYNKKFFEENTLFLFYIAEPSMDITHEIMYVGKGSNELFIEMKKYVPEAADTAMAGHIIAVSMKKEDAKEVDSAVIIVPETVNMSNNPELIKTEPGTLLYIMGTGDSYTKPRVALNKDGSFHFFMAPFGNSCKGTYRLEQGDIILETDDGLYTYVFKEDGNNLIFDADKSSEIAKVSYSVDSEPVLPVEDGDVFKRAVT